MVALVKPDNRILDTIIQGDCLSVLRSLADNSVDACVVDPPYGLGEVKDIAGLLQAWIRDEDDSRYLGKSGFMGKEWDAGVPGPRYWREVLRVMKPGAHILCFASTRTVDLMMIALRLAGFQCRDTLMWITGQGFPKNTDISKKIDKMKGAKRKVIGQREYADGTKGHWQPVNREIYAQDEWSKSHRLVYDTAPSTPEAQRYAGTGTALKPAHEPIILARKPISEKSIAANVLKWGTGGLNIDQCRVAGESWKRPTTQNMKSGNYNNPDCENLPIPKESHPQGRFPSNLLLSHSLFCTPLGTRKVKANGPSPQPTTRQSGIINLGLKNNGTISYRDEDGMEEVQAWDCTEDCPIRLLDEQTKGTRAEKPSANGLGGWRNQYVGGDTHAYYRGTSYHDQGGASRYFTQFCYTAKASRSERNRGCEGLPEKESRKFAGGEFIAHPEKPATTSFDRQQANNHPTVKPLALMSWLCRLITPPNGIVLDCFAGSGSTLVACVQEGLHFIGIEQSAEYAAIARARIAHALWEVQG